MRALRKLRRAHIFPLTRFPLTGDIAQLLAGREASSPTVLPCQRRFVHARYAAREFRSSLAIGAGFAFCGSYRTEGFGSVALSGPSKARWGGVIAFSAEAGREGWGRAFEAREQLACARNLKTVSLCSKIQGARQMPWGKTCCCETCCRAFFPTTAIQQRTPQASAWETRAYYVCVVKGRRPAFSVLNADVG